MEGTIWSGTIWSGGSGILWSGTIWSGKATKEHATPVVYVGISK